MKFHRFLWVGLAMGLAGWFSCADLERSNPLDPKNPDSFNKQVVLAELFVNDSVRIDSADVFQNSAYAEAALESLYGEFTCTRLVYAQYHVGNQYHDSLDTAPNLDYYKKYVAANGSLGYAVPDIYINGPATRLLGASRTDIYSRLRDAVTQVLDQRCAFGIQGSFTVDTIAVTITISAQIARLGQTDSPADLHVQYIILNDFGTDYHHLVVCYLPPTVDLPALPHGEVYTVPAQTIANPRYLAAGSIGIIICIKDSHQTVLQSTILLPQ